MMKKMMYPEMARSEEEKMVDSLNQDQMEGEETIWIGHRITKLKVHLELMANPHLKEDPLTSK
jgi:hypothetical protein